VSFNSLLQTFSTQFPYGDFQLMPDEIINNIVERENVPDEYGVYLIYGVKNNQKELIYIGKSGTLKQDGTFKEQKLRKRLTMKQNGIYRKEFFRKLMRENNYHSLYFKWFITYSSKMKELPAYVEATLLNEFFKENHKLPKLNKTF